MNQQNSSRLIKTIALLVCVGGVAWFSFSLLGKYQQVQRLKQADDVLGKEDYKSAIEAYDRLLAADVANEHLIWINRGYALLGLNQYQDMLQSCSNATSIEPNAALGWNCQGEALYYLKQNQKALNAFEQAIEKNPQKSAFWLNKARVLSELQQYNRAIAASDRAIELIGQSNRAKQTNSFAIAFNQKGQNLLKIKQYQKALEAFEQSLKNSPDYLSPQQGKGIALYELGNYEEAIAMLGEILKRNNLADEQKAISLVYTGVSLCQIHKSTAAAAAFQEVLALTKDIQSKKIAQKGCGIQ